MHLAVHSMRLRGGGRGVIACAPFVGGDVVVCPLGYLPGAASVAACPPAVPAGGRGQRSVPALCVEAQYKSDLCSCVSQEQGADMPPPTIILNRTEDTVAVNLAAVLLTLAPLGSG